MPRPVPSKCGSWSGSSRAANAPSPSRTPRSASCRPRRPRARNSSRAGSSCRRRRGTRWRRCSRLSSRPAWPWRAPSPGFEFPSPRAWGGRARLPRVQWGSGGGGPPAVSLNAQPEGWSSSAGSSWAPWEEPAPTAPVGKGGGDLGVAQSFHVLFLKNCVQVLPFHLKKLARQKALRVRHPHPRPLPAFGQMVTLCLHPWSPKPGGEVEAAFLPSVKPGLGGGQAPPLRGAAAARLPTKAGAGVCRPPAAGTAEEQDHPGHLRHLRDQVLDHRDLRRRHPGSLAGPAGTHRPGVPGLCRTHLRPGGRPRGLDWDWGRPCSVTLGLSSLCSGRGDQTPHGVVVSQAREARLLSAPSDHVTGRGSRPSGGCWGGAVLRGPGAEARPQLCPARHPLGQDPGTEPPPWPRPCQPLTDPKQRTQRAGGGVLGGDTLGLSLAVLSPRAPSTQGDRVPALRLHGRAGGRASALGGLCPCHLLGRLGPATPAGAMALGAHVSRPLAPSSGYRVGPARVAPGRQQRPQRRTPEADRPLPGPGCRLGPGRGGREGEKRWEGREKVRRGSMEGRRHPGAGKGTQGRDDSASSRCGVGLEGQTGGPSESQWT